MDQLEVLGDRYELQEPIGRGGMATIYRAVDLRMGRTVAAKILREVYSSDPKFVTRFQREARAASALQHPNIVQVFDYGQSGESYYIVMEFVEGSDLRRYLKRNGILSNERAIEIAHDIGLGLGAAHKRGIVHRDVKPQNIMLNDKGLVKLTDFGIASMYKDAEAERLTTTGMTLGTVQYYAPEQAQGEIVSPAADIYALGIVMYEMLCGRTPFDGETPVAVAMRHIQDAPDPPTLYNPRITPGLERIILRCLEKDPRDRYKDGDALAYALENLARQGQPGRRSGPAGTGIGPITPGRSTAMGAANRGTLGNMYGGAAVASNPMRPPVGLPEGFSDAPTYDGSLDADNGFGGGTFPFAPAGPTAPRAPSPISGGRPPVFGSPSQPGAPKKRNGPLIATIVVSAMLLLGLACLLLGVTTNGFGLGSAFGGATPTATVPLVMVPNFVGMQYNDALSQATAKHLQVAETQVASTQPVGQVIDQNPAANTTVQQGTTVTLTVSSGPGKITVPNVVGLPFQQAENKLTEAGLKFNLVTNPYNPSYQPGIVISTTPPAGTSVDPTQVIQLEVNGNPPPTATPATATATPTCPATPVTGPGTPTPTPAC
jgi:serine/threonine-protein kinase